MNGAANNGAAGPAPFLLKTYDMVDDPLTDEIVSWTHTTKSFVVWNPTDFAARLLPTYFKHNNFSSFVRQLNTYGFHKIDPERWEFANEDFVQGQKHLLKNIHRRKPIHSHSNPPAGTVVDSERTFLEQQIERLLNDKSNLEAALWRFKQQQSGTISQLEDLDARLAHMEQRQLKMINFLQMASANPKFMENMMKMAAAASLDLSSFQKKRRLPLGVESSFEAQENNYYFEDGSTSKKDSGCILDEEFCDKLKLELCPAYRKGNLVVASTQSSIEDAGTTKRKQSSDGLRPCPPLVPETVDFCDTGASIYPSENLSFPTVVDEGDVLFPCHLSLAVASSTVEVGRFEQPCSAPNVMDQQANDLTLSEANMSLENGLNMLAGKGQNGADFEEVGAANNNRLEASPSQPNDGFWEQFFTERPGSVNPDASKEHKKE